VQDAVDALEGGSDFGAEEPVGIGDDAEDHGFRMTDWSVLSQVPKCEGPGAPSELAGHRAGCRGWGPVWAQNRAENGHLTPLKPRESPLSPRKLALCEITRDLFPRNAKF
jgi:hypothetical protein